MCIQYYSDVIIIITGATYLYLQPERLRQWSYPLELQPQGAGSAVRNNTVQAAHLGEGGASP